MKTFTLTINSSERDVAMAALQIFRLNQLQLAKELPADEASELMSDAQKAGELCARFQVRE